MTDILSALNQVLGDERGQSLADQVIGSIEEPDKQNDFQEQLGNFLGDQAAAQGVVAALNTYVLAMRAVGNNRIKAAALDPNTVLSMTGGIGAVFSNEGNSQT